ncbi:MAG: hypothetical protein GKR88_10095 [Flavobacteriaceae bacterium]|nr:MAG: hypothetical protein GKR88_10095 [Flavobacteriaceae bacterium]
MNKKHFLLLLAILSMSFVFSQKQEKIKLKGVIMKNDYHKKISWVKSKPVSLESKDFTVSTLSTTYLQIYFGMMEKNGKPYLTNIRLVNHFDNSDWIFYDEVSYLLGSRKEIRTHKGVVFKVKTDKTVRDVDNGVTEHSDILALGQAKEFIKHVIENDETRLNVRFTNNDDNKYQDFTISSTKKLKKHFKVLINNYNILNKAYKIDETF